MDGRDHKYKKGKCNGNGRFECFEGESDVAPYMYKDFIVLGEDSRECVDTDRKRKLLVQQFLHEMSFFSDPGRNRKVENTVPRNTSIENEPLEDIMCLEISTRQLLEIDIIQPISVLVENNRHMKLTLDDKAADISP